MIHDFCQQPHWTTRFWVLLDPDLVGIAAFLRLLLFIWHVCLMGERGRRPDWESFKPVWDGILFGSSRCTTTTPGPVCACIKHLPPSLHEYSTGIINVASYGLGVAHAHAWVKHIQRRPAFTSLCRKSTHVLSTMGRICPSDSWSLEPVTQPQALRRVSLSGVCTTMSTLRRRQRIAEAATLPSPSIWAWTIGMLHTPTRGRSSSPRCKHGGFILHEYYYNEICPVLEQQPIRESLQQDASISAVTDCL